MTVRARITGLGRNMPERIMTNHEMEKIVDTSDEWITTRTGIKERRVAEGGVTSSQLAAPAALEAIKQAGVSPTDIDLIICATATPDMMFPSTAALVQKEIGAQGCPAFDISVACSGFVYGLTVADSFIKAGRSKRVLIIGVEILSKVVDWEDRTTCVLFGDGAAAAVVTGCETGEGLIDSQIAADGDYHDYLTGPGPGSDARVTMKGNQVFKVAVKNMTESALSILAANGLSLSDVDLVVPHQANKRILNAVAKSLGVPDEKMFINVHKYGNTSAATIPIALYEACEEGRLKKGDKVLLVAFGGGFSWGASLLTW